MLIGCDGLVACQRLVIAVDACFAHLGLVVLLCGAVNDLMVGLDGIDGNVLLIGCDGLVACQCLVIALEACFAQRCWGVLLRRCLYGLKIVFGYIQWHILQIALKSFFGHLQII